MNLRQQQDHGIFLKSSKKLWLVVLLYMLSTASRALDPAKSTAQYIHDSWNSESGLPTAAVWRILQTRDGYMWLGIGGGVARFDGIKFTVFNRENTEAIHFGLTEQLYEDKQGNLWIGTWDGGGHGDLIRYRDGYFHSFTYEEGWPGNNVTSITEDSTGTVWIGTHGGPILKYQDGHLSVVHLDAKLRYPMILADDHYNVWATTLNGLVRLDARRSDAFEIVRETSGLETYSLAKDTIGNIWVATNRGVFRVVHHQGNTFKVDRWLNDIAARLVRTDRQGGVWIQTKTFDVFRFAAGALTKVSGLPKAMILKHAFLEDKDGSLWLGTTVGLCRKADLSSSRKFECYSDENSLPMDNILSLFEDREGSLWVGTQSMGLHRFRDGSVTTYSIGGRGRGAVWAVLEAADKSLWIGTTSGLHHLVNEKMTECFTAAKEFNHISSLLEDHNGALWAGTMNGINQLSRSKSYRTLPQLRGIHVQALYEDHLGNVWIGSEYEGIFRFTKGKVESYAQQSGTKGHTISMILEDHNSNLWFSTDVGLIRLRDGEFENVRLPTPMRENLPTWRPTYLYEDSEHSLWIGSWDGLFRYRDGDFTVYKKKNGLFADGIWAILEDSHGNLWMSSDFGVFRVSKRELNDFADGRISRIHSMSYGISDGMPNAECNGGDGNEAQKTSGGQLLFACMAGVMAIDPQEIYFNSVKPPVVIEQVSINGNRTNSLSEVSVGRGELEFHFTALSFAAPKKNQFKYQLEGYDRDWIDAGARRVAYYTNIPPGKYRFRVVASNNDGVWNNEGASVGLDLRPHFYQTKWFYFLFSISALLMGAAAYRLRIRKIEERKRDLEVLVDKRTGELRQQVVERKRAEEAAHQATRARSEFLANMSHEIRTPLNGVIGMLQLASYTELTSEQKDLLGIAWESANGLLVVTNDILDFSKIEAGKLELDPTEFDLAEVLAEATRVLALRAHQKHLELAFEIRPEVPGRVVADAARLKQVLINLLGNAVKFTEKGEVVLRVEKEGVVDAKEEEPGRGNRASGSFDLHFIVSDTGIGIPKDKQKLIFEAFSQADASTTRKFGGTGLGLAICSHIVKMMGGRIWLESDPGQGSQFHFTMRLESGREHHSERVLDLRQLPVLVIDDNATNRHILETMLLSWEMVPVTAESGMAGLKIMRKAVSAGCPFPLVLVDSQMPEMDGFQFIEHMREDAETKSAAVMMLTSDDYNITAARCRTMGIQAHLIKPVKKSELLATIQALIAPKRELTSTKPGLPVAPRSLRILLAEDHPVNQKVAVRLLEKGGHTVKVAGTGVRAFELLESQAIDLVLMDVQMPEMDGFEATGRIREKERDCGARHIPIIAMTAHAMRGDQERCLEAGMDGYVAKPIDYTALMKEIDRVIQERTVTLL